MIILGTKRVNSLRECQLRELTITHSSFSSLLGHKAEKREITEKS